MPPGNAGSRGTNPRKPGYNGVVESLGAKVLVVDDEAPIRDLLEYGLERAGFSVRCVPDGRLGLDALRTWRPDIVVLDVMLPEVDGMTLLPELRRLTEVPIVMLSARSETSDKVDALTSGADDYVAKPFELEELVARLNSALRRPRLEQRQTFAYDDLTVDLERRAVFRGERRIENRRPHLDGERFVAAGDRHREAFRVERGRVGADREKHRVAERQFPGVPEQQIEADGEQREDQDRRAQVDEAHVRRPAVLGERVEVEGAAGHQEGQHDERRRSGRFPADARPLRFS